MPAPRKFIVIVQTGPGPKVAVTSLLLLMVNTQVLVTQAVASPLPLEKTPGDDGVGWFAESRTTVPVVTWNTHWPPLGLLHTPLPEVPTAPEFGPAI